MLGTRTRGGMMEGADESTVLRFVYNIVPIYAGDALALRREVRAKPVGPWRDGAPVEGAVEQQIPQLLRHQGEVLAFTQAISEGVFHLLFLFKL